MRLLRRKSEQERLLDKMSDSVAAVLHGAERATVVKAALIAGGAAALTAGSAAISSLRRRTEATS
jgi:hypothetical protein